MKDRATNSTLKLAARTLATVAMALDLTGILAYCARARPLFGDPPISSSFESPERLDPRKTMLLVVILAAVRIVGLLLYVNSRRRAVDAGGDEAKCRSDGLGARCRGRSRTARRSSLRPRCS